MRVPVSQLKAKLSEHLRRVETGGTVIVLDRKRPIARLVPLESDVDGLEIVPASRSFASVRGIQTKRVVARMSSLEALRIDRGQR